MSKEDVITGFMSRELCEYLLPLYHNLCLKRCQAIMSIQTNKKLAWIIYALFQYFYFEKETRYKFKDLYDMIKTRRAYTARFIIPCRY